MSEPKLQAPGAGLPLVQRIALKLFVGPFISKRVPWEVSRARYEKLTNKILTTAESITDEKRKIKILVDPIVGLEDSSRYWSVDMLLEHLLIVATQMEAMILNLSLGIRMDKKVDIAKVKPTEASSSQSTVDILAQYKAFAPDLMKRLDLGMKDRESPLSHYHPWFGQLNARQWYWLFTGHQSVHWNQLKQIKNKVDSINT